MDMEVVALRSNPRYLKFELLLLRVFVHEVDASEQRQL